MGLLKISNLYFRLLKVKVKWSRYRSSVAQMVGRGLALLFLDRGTRRGWVVSSTPRPHFTPGRDPVPILQEAGWASGSVWTGGKSRPHQVSMPGPPARSSVAIPTEVPDPLRLIKEPNILQQSRAISVSYCFKGPSNSKKNAYKIFLIKIAFENILSSLFTIFCHTKRHIIVGRVIGWKSAK